MNTAPPTKVELRTNARAILDSLPDADRTRGNVNANDHLTSDILHRCVSTVMLYLARGSELDLAMTIDSLLECELTVAVPAVDEHGSEMRAVELHSLDPSGMTVDRFGIHVPRSAVEIDPATIQLVVVPGLAFDRHGHRLGRGGGFYDRFLNRLGTQAARVGACYDVQMVEAVPVESHDEPMDVILTDTSRYDRSQ